MVKYAYCTVLSDFSYIPGLIALYNSLKRWGGQHDIVCVMTSEFSTNQEVQRLEADGLKIKIVERINVSGVESINGENNAWNNSFLKLRMFELEEYDKCVYFDCDIIINNTIEELFDYPHISAVENGKQFTGSDQKTNSFNSGVIVFEPSKKIAEDMIATIKATMDYCKDHNIGCGDQDVMNYYFNKIHMIFTRIPERYNTSVTRYDERLRQKEISEKFNEIAVWHFVGKRKPWKKDIINTIIIYILKRRLNGVQSILLFKKYEKK